MSSNRRYAVDNTRNLIDPNSIGAVKIAEFLRSDVLDAAGKELGGLPWMDSRETYVNARGVTIVQNHDTFAIDLTVQDQSLLLECPAIKDVQHAVERYIGKLAKQLATLEKWKSTELSIHRYDAQEGLSYHRDNKRFIGVVAIVSLQGESDLWIKRADDSEEAIETCPGDLLLLRAPGLIDDMGCEIRPEHAVHLITPTRTSLMLRNNSRPQEPINGFRFNNVSY